MAEAIYNRLTKSNDASSAGTHVEGVGMTLSEFNAVPGVSSSTIEVMNDAGYQIGNRRQTQLTKDMIAQYDLIIGMAAKRYTPSWLSRAPHYRYWKIPTQRAGVMRLLVMLKTRSSEGCVNLLVS